LFIGTSRVSGRWRATLAIATLKLACAQSGDAREIDRMRHQDLAMLNMMIWNAAIYSTPVAQDIVMDEL
jgi:hypothetical protein